MPLTPEQEAVLITVEGLQFGRELPTPGVIGLRSDPPLTTAEVMLAAGELARGGYVYVGDLDGATYYEMTASGTEYADAIRARGT